MKVSSILVWFVAGTMAKNVFDFSKLKSNVEKREAKNIVSFDDVRASLEKEQSHKRDQQVINDQPVTLETVLQQYRDISIFAGYVRDNQEVVDKIASEADSVVVIAPSDNAITNKLGGKKPWEFPKSLGNAVDEDEVITSNLNYFISNHIALATDLEIKESSILVTMLSGKQVDIVGSSNGVYLVDGGKKILVDLSRLAENGNLFIINDALVKPDSA